MGISLRALLIAGLFGQVSLSLHAQATDLIISEYVEGSGNNKYIELYNGTSSNINLGLYQLRLYANGSTTATTGTPAMTGTLAPGATIVYRNTSATAYTGTAIINSALNFNGDDAIGLYRISGTVLVDLVGNIGCDPGTAWASGSHSTLDRTLVRKYNICTGITADPAHTGNTVAGCPFPTLESEWDVNGVDVVSNLGSHYMDCSPVVNFSTASSSVAEAGGLTTVTLNLQGIIPAGSVTLNIANGVGAIYGTDYSTNPAPVGSDITISFPAGTTTLSFDVNITNDGATEANETITFTITGSTGGIVLGTTLSHTLTIIDDDGPPTVYFATTSVTVLEDPTSAQTFTIAFSSAAPSAGFVTITTTAGPGATCGTFAGIPNSDFQVQGYGCPINTFNVGFNAGATSATFTVNVYGDNVAGGYLIESTEQVTFTITNSTGGTAIGAPNAGVLNIADDDSPPTVLSPGDLVIVGLNTNNGSCSGNTTEDLVSFFSFKQITTGTKLIVTDNGYSRCSAGTWGNNEGTVELTRTGPTIPAGQVITFRIRGQYGPGNVVGLAPDANWTCAPLGLNPTSVDMSSSGDQIFFMQGGTWNPGTAGNHNATYSGTVLYGFSTTGVWLTPPPASCTSSSANNMSALPISMPCFSMAPTSSQAFNKYNGPLTLASQRDWILRMDDGANWTTYGSCSAYNSASPNWLLAPIMPIIPGAPVPGLWRGSSGASGTDWFDCKNWDDATVPTATTTVIINETANNHCIVGITAGGSAQCNQLVMTNGGVPKNLTVQNGSTLAVGGPITVQRTTSGTQIALLVQGSSNLTATNCTVQGTNANEAALRVETTGNDVSFSGDLTINPGGLVDIQGAGVGGTISIAGNYQNLATESALEEQYGTLQFNGNTAQNISTTGFTEVFQNLTVNKSSGSLNLNTNVDLLGALNLTNGNVNTTATEMLTIRAGGTAFATGGLVNGPMVKIGNTNFTFPVGKGTARRPIQVSSIAGSVTDAFRAEYFPVDPSFFGTTGDATLHHISTCEYWTLDRAAGTPNAVVTLYWEAPYSCGVTNLSELRVAQWDDTAIPAPGTWRDRGGVAVGSFASGFIPTAAVQAQFNATTTAWTLASTTANNPLPITLLRFTAEPEGDMVRLDWLTASEQDNALFTVERSRDAMAFEEVLNVPGALNSSTLLAYSELDRAPYPGLSYYRLRQTDTDGSSTYSNVVSVLFGPVNERPPVVFGTGETWTAVHSFPAGSTYEIVDMTGRRVLGGRTAMEGRTDLYGVVLSRGAYVFRITDGDRVESQRFVY